MDYKKITIQSEKKSPLLKKKDEYLKLIKIQLFQARFIINSQLETISDIVYQRQYWIGSLHFKKKKIAQEFIKKNFFYFSYRDNIINCNFLSDVSWGCTFRVGQMLFARALIQHQKGKLSNSEQQISKQVRKKIVDEFLDGNNEQQIRKYSIKNFFLNDDQLIESHMKLTQYFYRMQKLHQQNPMKGAANLVIQNCFQNIIISSILKKLGYEVCQCKQQKLNCQNCCKSKIKFSKSIIIIVYVTIQFKSQNQAKLKQNLFKLLKLRQSLGFMGGSGSYALYFIGFDNNNNLIYLDPHKTQQSQNIMNSKVLQTYQQADMFSIDCKKISKQLALGFYVKNRTDLQNFIKNLKQIDCNFINIQFRQKEYKNKIIMIDDEQNKNPLIQSSNFLIVENSKTNIGLAQNSQIKSLQSTLYSKIKSLEQSTYSSKIKSSELIQYSEINSLSMSSYSKISKLQESVYEIIQNQE